jgi:CRISPR-associated endonuclease Cas1 subtype II
MWSEQIKKDVWTCIVYEKISNQSLHLQKRNKLDESKLIASYLDEILPGDESNREGHAAKVYFNALFGMEFTRKDEDNVINAALNYGYALILSAVNREIVLNGYLTQLGLFHDNQFNHFNLGCDIMEPLRIAVDEEVQINSYSKFETDEKHDMVSILNRTVSINDTQQVMLNAIKIYVKSVFDALNEDNVYLIKFPRLL